MSDATKRRGFGKMHDLIGWHSEVRRTINHVKANISIALEPECPPEVARRLLAEALEMTNDLTGD